MDILENLDIFHTQILSWYNSFGRKELPWRNLKRDGSNVYEIYVSEIMLQQTQVKRVLELYYFPFLVRFPSLESLARAKEYEVLEIWQGLGYYTRARNMHKSAQICMRDFNNTLPRSKDKLLQLPGIGKYTAGAILCFGFGESVGFVDGNIRRLFCRLFGLKDQNLATSLADKLLDSTHSFDYNQALLDLGALICAPKIARCEICPLARFCKGKDNPLAYPVKAKKHYESLELDLLILCDERGNIGFIKSESKLYKGLYNLPQIPDIAQIPRDVLDSGILSFIGEFKHSYTKFKIRTKVWIHKNHPKISQHLNLNPCKIQFFAPNSPPALSNLSKKALQIFTHTY